VTANSVANEKFVLKFSVSDFDEIFHGMCTDIFEYVLQGFTAIFTVLAFWQNYKDLKGDLAYHDLKIAS